MTGSFGIQRDAVVRPSMIRLLTPQHPSWNIAAPWFLTQVTQNIIKWKIARQKLSRTKALAPAHAFDPPDYLGQSR